MKYIIWLFIFLFSCNNYNKKEENEKEFEMYEMTEMALLMEKMYHENEALKFKIINGESVGNFPDEYLKILTAEMTDPSANDSIYKNYAKLFIEKQRSIHNEKGKEKENFNKMVDACIVCHEVKCTGPIMRIKKLYLK